MGRKDKDTVQLPHLLRNVPKALTSDFFTLFLIQSSQVSRMIREETWNGY